MSYVREASRWIKFFSQHPSIPGVQSDFNEETVEDYLFFRARTCKSMRVILTRLKWMGMIYGHILPTDARQQPSLLYQQINDIVRRVKVWLRSDRDTRPQRALGLGNTAVTVIFSYFCCFSESAFNRLRWTDAAFLTQTIMGHTGCMRYGHFGSGNLPRTALTRAPLADAWKLDSTWDKYPGSRHSIMFYDTPPARPAIYRLVVPPHSPPRSVTASEVISWFVRRRDRLFPHSRSLFPQLPSDLHRHFGVWLKTTILGAFPGFPLISLVRPHGLRAGWVCDRRREGIPDQTTMREGRWRSLDAMATYDRQYFASVCPSGRLRYHTPARS